MVQNENYNNTSESVLETNFEVIEQGNLNVY